MTFPLRFILDLPDWISPRFRHTLAQGAATSQGSRGGEIGSGRSKPEAESETHWWRGSPVRGGPRPVDVEVGIPHVHDTTTVARHADADRVRSRAHLGAPGVLKRAKLIRAVEWDFRDHPAGAGGAKEGVASRIAERAVHLAATMRKPASCKQDGRNGDEHHRLHATRLRRRGADTLGVCFN